MGGQFLDIKIDETKQKLIAINGEFADRATKEKASQPSGDPSSARFRFLFAALIAHYYNCPLLCAPIRPKPDGCAWGHHIQNSRKLYLSPLPSPSWPIVGRSFFRVCGFDHVRVRSRCLQQRAHHLCPTTTAQRPNIAPPSTNMTRNPLASRDAHRNTSRPKIRNK